MKFVIPTGDYANMQVDVVGIGQTFAEAKADGLTKGEALYESVETKANLVLKNVTNVAENAPERAEEAKILKNYFGPETIKFYHGDHSYQDDEGNSYLSGSKFAHQFGYEFDADMIAPRYANKYGVPVEDILQLWKDKGEASTTLGTALHQALETYGKHYALNGKIGKPSGVHPILLPIVEAFFTEERLNEVAVYEASVIDAKNKRVGQIDRMVITGNKKCIIEDYKTNIDLYKFADGSPKNLKPPYAHLPNIPLAKYQLQLNFYRAIVVANGWTVEALRIHWWNDIAQAWEVIELKEEDIDAKRIDISQVI